MPPSVDKGFYVRKPPWWLAMAEQMGQSKDDAIIVQEYPETFEEARKLVIPWEVECEPVTVGIRSTPEFVGLVRSDNREILSVRPSSYAIINNSAFGEVIQTIVGSERIKFECLLSLYGGRQIVALVCFDTPLRIDKDQSLTFQYLALTSRHDGLGGLKGTPTAMRIECANMSKMAELIGDKQKVSFTIRHTSSWKERVNEAAIYIQMARLEGELYTELANALVKEPVNAEQFGDFQAKFFPISSDQSELEKNNALKRRGKLSKIYLENNQSIVGTKFGLLQAAIEYLDHGRRHNNQDTYITRTALRAEPKKHQALALVKAL